MNDDRIRRIADALEDWLRPDNQGLASAIERSAEENLFSIQDMRHRILTLKNTLTYDALRHWSAGSADRAGTAQSAVLCLHAGNLPAVGIQDLLACCLTGSRYIGKVSRKDPYLLPSLLDKLVEHKAMTDPRWSVELQSLQNAATDAVLFSGSARSVPPVRKEIDRYRLAKKGASYLIRTAHYSIAWLDSISRSSMEDLTEGIFRYGGRGCRSVAVVISPFSLDEFKCSFTDYIESFWLHNPQHQKPPASLYYRYAYNKAVGHPQAWLDDFLIEQTTMIPEEAFVLHWVVGDEHAVRNVVNSSGSGLQSVYVTGDDVKIEGLTRQTELLSDAQKPSVFWRPDGMDTVSWLRGRDGERA